MYLSYAALAAFVAGAFAAPTSVAHRLHEKREILPERWTKGERLDGSLFVPVRIGLTQSNLEEGHDRLMEVSTPGSPKYGRYYSEEEIHDLFAPSEVSVESVRAWLRDHGIDPARVSQSFNKQWIQLDAKIAELESLLKTKYHLYTHESGRKNVACEEYYVPEHVTEHVDYITPGIKLHAVGGTKSSDLEKRTFGYDKNKGSPLPPLKAPLPFALSVLEDNPLALSTCGVAITPACLRAEYGFPIGTKAAPGNKLGIFEDLNDKYAQEDLDLFFTSLFPRIPIGTHPQLKGIDGATAPAAVTAAGPESDLDFQISYPIIYPQGSVLFQTDDNVYEANYTFEGFLNNFLDAIDGSYCTYSAFGETGNSPLDPPYPDKQPGGYKGKLQCGVYKPTNVISISYGGQEADLPMSYQRRQCNEYMKLGMRGISILVASGDSGVAGPAGDDSSNGCLGGGKIFSPDFPATCPYLTTVGATVLPPGADPSQDKETAVTRFPSGGGFSNIYPIPSYQKTAVENYFANHAPSYPYYNSVYNSSFGANGGIYNRAGRGYPDVSAVGDNVVIFNMGAPTLIGGTSAAAPVFASILNRINEERIAAGKSTVGFVNPTLYAHPGILNDVTQGTNPGCGTNGFSCAKGWDPLTGLGTPNYPKMLKVFMSQ